MKSILMNPHEACPERQRSSPSAARNPSMVAVELNNTSSLLINNSAFVSDLHAPAKISTRTTNDFALVVESFRLCAKLMQSHISDCRNSPNVVPSAETLKALTRAAELQENLEHTSRQPYMYCTTRTLQPKGRHEKALYLDAIKALTSSESSEYISSTVLFNLALTQKIVKNTTTALTMFDHAFMASALLERHSYGRFKMTAEILKNVIDIETTMPSIARSSSGNLRQDGTDDLTILCTNLLEVELEAISSEECCTAAKSA